MKQEAKYGLLLLLLIALLSPTNVWAVFTRTPLKGSFSGNFVVDELYWDITNINGTGIFSQFGKSIIDGTGNGLVPFNLELKIRILQRSDSILCLKLKTLPTETDYGYFLNGYYFVNGDNWNNSTGRFDKASGTGIVNIDIFDDGVAANGVDHIYNFSGILTGVIYLPEPEEEDYEPENYVLITPSMGPPGTAFTINDVIKRIQQGDKAYFYMESEQWDIQNYIEAENIFIAPNGDTLQGIVPETTNTDMLHYITVRPSPEDPPRFEDIPFTIQ